MNNLAPAIAVVSSDNLIGGPSLTDGSAYTPPPATRQLTLRVSREEAGPMLARLEIEDRCGRHPTFVGAGRDVR